MSIRNLLFLGLIITATSGCNQDIFLSYNGNMPTADKIAQISQGQNREQVRTVLGTPSSITQFDGENWLYMSSTVKKVAFFRPEEIKREILEIKFDKSGKVSELVNYTKEDGTDISIATDETPTAGHKIGFFRKYFGGVGTYMPVAPTGD